MNNSKRRRIAKAAAKIRGNKPPTNYHGPNRATRRSPEYLNAMREKLAAA